MEYPSNQSPIFRQIQERLEVISNNGGYVWVMCPAGHGIGVLSTDIKLYLESVSASGFAHVDLKRCANVNQPTTHFLELLAKAWGFDLSECGNSSNDQPDELLDKLIAKARGTHNKLLLQIDNIDKVTVVEPLVFTRLRTIQENAKRRLAGWADSTFSTIVVTKWTRRFIIENWESDFQAWLETSGYGTNHTESQIKLLTAKDLKDYLELSDATDWAIRFLHNYCGGFFEAVDLIKDDLVISNRFSTFFECCQREGSEEDRHELEGLLPLVDDVAVRVLKHLDPSVGDTSHLDQFYKCYAGLDSMQSGFAHPYKDCLLRIGDSRPTDFILSGLKALFSGMEELERTSDELDELYQIQNWQAITIKWSDPDKFGYNFSKIKILQAHYLDFLFGDFSRAPGLECSKLLSSNEKHRDLLTEIKDKCGNDHVKEKAVDSIEWLKKHHSWLSKLNDIPGFEQKKVIPILPKLLNNALLDIEKKNSFDKLRAVLRLLHVGILRQKLPYFREIDETRQEELLCSIGHIIFDCKYKNFNESVFYQTQEFQNTPGQQLTILKSTDNDFNPNNEFNNMHTYVDFLTWLADKEGISDQWITLGMKQRWDETLSSLRNTPAHNATYNQTEETRRLFRDFSEQLLNLLLDACEKKWPRSKVDHGLEEVLPIDVELTS